MILSLWLWGPKHDGRRKLISVGGLLYMPLLAVFLLLAAGSLARDLLRDSVSLLRVLLWRFGIDWP